MSSGHFLAFFGIILIIAILTVILITRLYRNLWRRLQEMEGKGKGFAAGFRQGIETDVKVISKRETIAPNAGGYVKVDMQMEVLLPGKSPYQISACWLVEMDSLDLVLPDRNVPVKVDPRKSIADHSKYPLGKTLDLC